MFGGGGVPYTAIYIYKCFPFVNLLIWQNSWQRQLKEERTYFGSRVQGRVHSGGDGRAAEAGGSRSQGTHSQEVERGELWGSAQFPPMMGATDSRMYLPTSVNLINKILWSNDQRIISRWL